MARGGGLKRLAKLYGMVEQMHAMQVRAAAGAVHEVEQAAVLLAETRQVELNHGRAALAAGSRVESISVEKTEATHEARRALLSGLKSERRNLHEAAVREHRTSRVERRQIDGVLERARVASALEDERRAQSASDDRFLSRREWMRAATDSE